MVRHAFKMVIVTLVVLTGLLVLGGCADSTPSPAPVVRIVCPSLTKYTKTEQRDLSTELKEHPELVAIDRFLEDYSALRGQVRACQHSRT